MKKEYRIMLTCATVVSLFFSLKKEMIYSFKSIDECLFNPIVCNIVIVNDNFVSHGQYQQVRSFTKEKFMEILIDFF